MKTFGEYEAEAMETAEYPDIGANVLYPAAGCAGEAGEFLDKIKKFWRNKGTYDPVSMTPEERLECLKELGDQLWYITAAAEELFSSLETVAKLNIEKLHDRRARGVIKSTGDNR